MSAHSKETIDVVRAAMALAERDVDLGLASVEEIQAIPRTRFAPAERKQIVSKPPLTRTPAPMLKKVGTDSATAGRRSKRQMWRLDPRAFRKRQNWRLRPLSAPATASNGLSAGFLGLFSLLWQ
jgi:hypothetical protein